jgi:erythritol transport system ATP-binding protein
VNHPVLEARGITRVFPGTVALNGVDFAMRPGTVHALIGENGAGKSTLVKILAGADRPTSGALFMDGESLQLHSTRDADRHGIGIIYQELNLCPNLRVSDNIFLGREITTRAGTVDDAAQRRATEAVLAKLRHAIDPDALLGDLPLGLQQIVEIAKAIARDVRVLMMDEPTSALAPAEVDVLFQVIRELAAHGVSIIYISHRLEELLQIADEVTVLRDGVIAGQAPAATATIPWIVERMTGRTAAARQGSSAARTSEAVLQVRSLLVEHGSAESTFDIAAGEIVGLYGLMGAGRTELLECLMGVRGASRGQVLLNGADLRGCSVADRIASGIAMVPEDRQRSGLVQTATLTANMTLANLSAYRRGFWLSLTSEREAALRMMSDLRIKAAGADAPITSLSGGNQQKALIARCLLTNPRVLLMDEPTRGVDVGAKEEIASILRRLASNGLAILFASSELDEIRSMAHRVLVMANGAITAEFAASEVTDAALAQAGGAYERR